MARPGVLCRPHELSQVSYRINPAHMLNATSVRGVSNLQGYEASRRLQKAVSGGEFILLGSQRVARDPRFSQLCLVSFWLN